LLEPSGRANVASCRSTRKPGLTTPVSASLFLPRAPRGFSGARVLSLPVRPDFYDDSCNTCDPADGLGLSCSGSTGKSRLPASASLGGVRAHDYEGDPGRLQASGNSVGYREVANGTATPIQHADVHRHQRDMFRFNW